MPVPNLKNLDRPLPTLRDTEVVDISTTDYENEQGFIAVVNSSGNNQTVVFRTLEGSQDQTRTIRAGAFIGNVGGVPVALKAVRNATGSGTVTSIEVGIL